MQASLSASSAQASAKQGLAGPTMKVQLDGAIVTVASTEYVPDGSVRPQS
jgi:hypothetical protein